MTDPAWFKSSYSSNGGECVEVAVNLSALVPLRDSKDPDGPALTVTAGAWAAFLAELRSGKLTGASAARP
ncbi:DUF397 domain-containing protein [Streptomyces tateyamensis]|uniref:DUF397 domain-containing protein n=1 Tax=Streptomyces tateyamensis TaxID=565073 RepID=A0A2V4N9U9_9ACTN|nr:DUF397 domain-containing protein [Streptomyces tateyamensis]PYC76762.1 DUF397 domain-containing protein [Streptomyces tateyamensis]